VVDDYRDYTDFALFHDSANHQTAYSTQCTTGDDDLFHTTTDYDRPDTTSGQFRAYSLHQDDFCLYNKGTHDYLDFDSQIAFSIDGVDAAPIPLAEARLRPDADGWIASYDAEVRSLKERNT
jgi:hypothetical protein